jgi:ubiquinone/menaquinone biosynthesis C-methylase UbiE
MEIDLLKKYPKSIRDLDKRIIDKSDSVVNTARKFGKDFFDGDRKYGYGGFVYNPKYWTEVVKDFVNYYKLEKKAKVLDVGCAKGFMIYDFKRQFPHIDIFGIDISKYAIKNCHSEIARYVKFGDAKNIEYPDNYFDLVISINTIHNLEIEDCGKSLQEIQRVSKKNCFITVDAFKNEEEKERMYKWNLTAKTIMSVEDWKNFFVRNGYKGDYFWFIP